VYVNIPDPFRSAEHNRLVASLRPIRDVFGEGPALSELAFIKAP
jgi:hypothetical protein